MFVGYGISDRKVASTDTRASMFVRRSCFFCVANPNDTPKPRVSHADKAHAAHAHGALAYSLPPDQSSCMKLAPRSQRPTERLLRPHRAGSYDSGCLDQHHPRDGHTPTDRQATRIGCGRCSNTSMRPATAIDRDGYRRHHALAQRGPGRPASQRRLDRTGKRPGEGRRNDRDRCAPRSFWTPRRPAVPEGRR